jgi:hypothetical protein
MRARLQPARRWLSTTACRPRLLAGDQVQPDQLEHLLQPEMLLDDASWGLLALQHLEGRRLVEQQLRLSQQRAEFRGQTEQRAVHATTAWVAQHHLLGRVWQGALDAAKAGRLKHGSLQELGEALLVVVRELKERVSGTGLARALRACVALCIQALRCALVLECSALSAGDRSPARGSAAHYLHGGRSR